MNYRISKYNPDLRTPTGSFLNDDWTSYSDIVVPGNAESYAKYKQVEDSYLYYLDVIMRANRIASCYVDSIEGPNISLMKNRGNELGSSISEEIVDGQLITSNKVLFLARLVLREIIWCRFQSNHIYIHFGYDYYMYIGGVLIDEETIRIAKEKGVYIEVFDSPYVDIPSG